MTQVNNSLYAQMQNTSIESIGKLENKFTVNESTNDFGDLLTSALNSVNELHKNAGKKINAFEMGDKNITLADVMVARAKAGIGSDAVIQIRNKAIEGYKEIMNMPV